MVKKTLNKNHSCLEYVMTQEKEVTCFSMHSTLLHNIKVLLSGRIMIFCVIDLYTVHPRRFYQLMVKLYCLRHAISSTCIVALH